MEGCWLASGLGPNGARWFEVGETVAGLAALLSLPLRLCVMQSAFHGTSQVLGVSGRLSLRHTSDRSQSFQTKNAQLSTQLLRQHWTAARWENICKVLQKLFKWNPILY